MLPQLGFCPPYPLQSVEERRLATIPPLGELTPRRGNRLTRWFGAFMLRRLGYHFTGEIPNLPKFVAIFAPHTRAKDFLVAMMAIFALGLRISWMGADWIFKYPFMRWIGGIPIDRSKSHGVVAQTVEQFQTREQLLIALSPEGTRKKSVPWKTGFFRIAEGAKVPIFMVGLCHTDREIRLGPALDSAMGFDTFMEQARDFYAEYLEKYGDHFGM